MHHKGYNSHTHLQAHHHKDSHRTQDKVEVVEASIHGKIHNIRANTIPVRNLTGIRGGNREAWEAQEAADWRTHCFKLRWLDNP